MRSEMAQMEAQVGRRCQSNISFCRLQMDHIPYYESHVNPPIRIPYLVREEHLYDGIEWETFPERKHIKWPSIGDLTPGTRKPVGAEHLVNLLSVAQSWLFFGMIEHVQRLLIPDAKTFDRNVYIDRSNSSISFLTTKPLGQMLLRWEMQTRLGSRSDQTGVARVIIACLEAAWKRSAALYELAQAQVKLQWINVQAYELTRTMVLCFFTLFQALSKPGLRHGLRSGPDGWHEIDLLNDRLRAAGSCRVLPARSDFPKQEHVECGVCCKRPRPSRTSRIPSLL